MKFWDTKLKFCSNNLKFLLMFFFSHDRCWSSNRLHILPPLSQKSQLLLKAAPLRASFLLTSVGKQKINNIWSVIFILPTIYIYIYISTRDICLWSIKAVCSVCWRGLRQTEVVGITRYFESAVEINKRTPRRAGCGGRGY